MRKRQRARRRGRRAATVASKTLLSATLCGEPDPPSASRRVKRVEVVTIRPPQTSGHRDETGSDWTRRATGRMTHRVGTTALNVGSCLWQKTLENCRRHLGLFTNHLTPKFFL